MRVSTNTGQRASRRIGYAFAGKAVGTANPNTLHGNLPSPNDAMGVVDENEIVSFFHDNAATRAFTIYYWDPFLNTANTAEGWVELGPSSTIYTQAVDPYAVASFTLRHNLLFFISADAAIANLFLAGSHRWSANATADLQGSGGMG